MGTFFIKFPALGIGENSLIHLHLAEKYSKERSHTKILR